jgi:hypothetical protein
VRLGRTRESNSEVLGLPPTAFIGDFVTADIFDREEAGRVERMEEALGDFGETVGIFFHCESRGDGVSCSGLCPGGRRVVRCGEISFCGLEANLLKWGEDVCHDAEMRVKISSISFRTFGYFSSQSYTLTHSSCARHLPLTLESTGF